MIPLVLTTFLSAKVTAEVRIRHPHTYLNTQNRQLSLMSHIHLVEQYKQLLITKKPQNPDFSQHLLPVVHLNSRSVISMACLHPLEKKNKTRKGQCIEEMDIFRCYLFLEGAEVIKGDGRLFLFLEQSVTIAIATS